jgi:hypothetical protein
MRLRHLRGRGVRAYGVTNAAPPPGRFPLSLPLSVCVCVCRIGVEGGQVEDGVCLPLSPVTALDHVEERGWRW